EIQGARTPQIRVDVERGRPMDTHTRHYVRSSAPGLRSRSALVELLAQALDLLVEGLAAAIGHRRLVGQARVELDEQRSLVGEHRRQPALEVVEVGDGVGL